MRILSFLLCILFSSVLLADCPQFSWHKTVTLKYINDGDTVTLDTGQLVRFIGINTPEIDYSNKHQSAPFALAAKRLLEEQLKKGDKAFIEGKLKSYEVDGQRREDTHLPAPR